MKEYRSMYEEWIRQIEILRDAFIRGELSPKDYFNQVLEVTSGFWILLTKQGEIKK